MTLSPEELARLAVIDQRLSQEAELVALAALFAEPPKGLALSEAARPVRARRPRAGLVLMVAVALLALVCGCFLGSLGQPTTVAAGTVAVLCAGLALVAAFRRHPGTGKSAQRRDV